MFKRRAPLTALNKLARAFWPRGGWRRAASYVMHRLRRLPDSSEKIARGIAAGVFVSFTPLFGFHFLMAAGIAWLLRGNILASLIATFFGNPITFPIIAAVSMELGSFMLDGPEVMKSGTKLTQGFVDGFGELRRVIVATFTGDPVNLRGLSVFFNQLFLPYLLGGLLPGAVTAFIMYLICKPIIHAYQARRRERFLRKIEERLERTARNIDRYTPPSD
ncbi:MAG: DUF2062 domain-containing protein [Rhodobacteraceae bacterium]|nr:DUF2062 domain-containing protein [Paracoccaceae bacterium]